MLDRAVYRASELRQISVGRTQLNMLVPSDRRRAPIIENTYRLTRSLCDEFIAHLAPLEIDVPTASVELPLAEAPANG